MNSVVWCAQWSEHVVANRRFQKGGTSRELLWFDTQKSYPADRSIVRFLLDTSTRSLKSPTSGVGREPLSNLWSTLKDVAAYSVNNWESASFSGRISTTVLICPDAILIVWIPGHDAPTAVVRPQLRKADRPSIHMYSTKVKASLWYSTQKSLR